MTAENCSPTVASRRAKYEGDFRVQTLLGVQQLDAQKRHGSRALERRKASARARTDRPPSAQQDAQANHEA